MYVTNSHLESYDHYSVVACICKYLVGRWSSLDLLREVVVLTSVTACSLAFTSTKHCVALIENICSVPPMELARITLQANNRSLDETMRMFCNVLVNTRLVLY